MKTIRLFPQTGSFAENKDVAREIRIEKIIPLLQKKEEITLDFTNIESATQSFIHALISDLIRIYGIEVLDRIHFKNCSEIVKTIITIVTDYMQERE